jgi:hypothetical protein
MSGNEVEERLRPILNGVSGLPSFLNSIRLGEKFPRHTEEVHVAVDHDGYGMLVAKLEEFVCGVKNLHAAIAAHRDGTIGRESAQAVHDRNFSSHSVSIWKRLRGVRFRSVSRATAS